MGVREEEIRELSSLRVPQRRKNGEWLEEEEREGGDPALSQASQPLDRCHAGAHSAPKILGSGLEFLGRRSSPNR